MKHKSIILVSLFIILAMALVFSSTIFFNFICSDSLKSETIISELSYMADQKIAFEDIQAYSNKFIPLSEQSVVISTPKDYWLKFKVNTIDSFRYINLDINTNRIDLYFPKNQQDTYQYINRTIKPLSYYSRYILVDVPNNIDTDKYFYLKINSTKISSDAISLYTSDQILGALKKQNITLGFFFGILFAVFLFNIIIYALFQDHIYIAIIGFLISIILYLIAGFCDGYDQTLLTLLSLTLLFSIVLVKLSLKTKELCKKMDYVLSILLVFVAFITILSVFTNFNLLYKLFSFLRFSSPILFTIISIQCYFKGHRPARSFGFGWACIAFGLIFYALSTHFRWIDLSYYFLLISITFAVLLFSISLLSNRMRFLLHQKTKLDKSMRLYHKLSVIDELSGLYNRRKLSDILTAKMNQAEDEKKTLSVAMLDLDNFKSINDQYGHPAGDLVIKELSSTIKDNIRNYDYAFRYGGEELLVLLYGADQLTATYICERIRKAFISKEYEELSGNNVTVSIGVSTLLDNDSVELLIQRADDALYLAKSNGKNQTCVK